MSHKVSRRQGLLALDYDNSDHTALLRKEANGKELLSLNMYLSFTE